MRQSCLGLLKSVGMPALAPADLALLTGIMDELLSARSPVCVLDGAAPVLARYYTRFVGKALAAAGVQVHACPPLCYGNVHEFVSAVVKSVPMETAVRRNAGESHVLVFRNADRLANEELVLLRELQASFPGLGFAYLYVGRSQLLREAAGKVFQPDAGQASERLMTLEYSEYFSPAWRRRLLVLLKGEERDG